MKDLQLNKESLVALQDDQMENFVGGIDDVIVDSCNKKSCNESAEQTEDNLEA